MAEAHQREIRASLHVLAEKLYRRNPREWRKSGEAGIETAVARIFSAAPPWNLPELEGRRGTEALALAFREDYRGDRVAALIAGLGGMIQRAFNDKSEFFILDDLDPQMLHNSARNVEIAAWKLAHDQDSRGGAFLLSNELGPAGRNLSFEREFGRIIGNLDLLARIIADKANRSIVRVMQSLATAVFLPVPIR
ncbi:MAG: hypothetical protein HY778_09205 [Betaproteobacteria bacterium]|nr:hypothetical protein [Betaproteobacteria bacterium]